MQETYNKLREDLQPMIDWYNLHIYWGVLHNWLGMTASSNQGKVIAELIAKEEAEDLWGPDSLEH